MGQGEFASAKRLIKLTEEDVSGVDVSAPVTPRRKVTQTFDKQNDPNLLQISSCNQKLGSRAMSQRNLNSRNSGS